MKAKRALSVSAAALAAMWWLGAVGKAQEEPETPQDAPASRPRPKLPLKASDYQPIPKVEFEDTDIRNIIKMVSDTTGHNILVSPNVNATVGIWASDINPVDLLDRVVAVGGVTYYVRENTISVVTWDEYKVQFGLGKEVYKPQYVDAEELANIIKTFLTDKGAAIPAPQSGSIVVLELPTALPKILELLKAVDSPGADTVFEVIRLKYAKAKTLAEQVEKLFEGGAARMARGESAVPPVVTAPPAAAKAAPAALGAPGAPRPLAVVVPKPEPGAAAKAVVAARGKVIVLPEERTNRVIIKGYRDDVAAVERLIEQLDVETADVTSGVRIYRLENTNAASVAKVLVDLMAAKGGNFASTAAPASSGEARTAGIKSFSTEMGSRFGVTEVHSGGGFGSGSSDRPAAPAAPPAPSIERPSASSGQGGSAEPLAGQPEQPTVSVNEETNSVVIRATAEQHREFARIIDDLDRPRPQVMLEAIIVQVTNDDQLDLGLELERLDKADHTQFRGLTNFGLSRVDPVTGQRSAIPSVGANFFIIRPDNIPLVLKAFQEATNARISSAPRLLVNDNSEGSIESLQEQPFTAVSVGTTVATTSFGGFATAGTTLAITPHISESNFIRLKYKLSLSSFTGTSSTSDSTSDSSVQVPPPRATNVVTSEAVVPDGHTIVVGGLRSVSDIKDVTKVPWVGDWPGIGKLFQRQVKTRREVTLFVFIRPTILRDRQFETLKYLSSQDVREARVRGDFPGNDVRMMNAPKAPKR